MRRRGFTLIEIMITIALIAILLATTSVAWLGLGQLRREGDFRFALQAARQQLGALEAAPFDSLPPQVLTVGPHGELKLSHRDLVPGTLRVTRLDSGGAVNATALGSLAGQRVVADYEYFLPGRNEAEVVGPGGKVALWNVPAVRVEAVRSVRGTQLTPVTGWQLSPDRLSLQVPPALEGRAVEVDYLGQRVRNRARGRFLDEQLRELDRPSPIKLMEIREDYGQQVGALRLTTLKVNE